MPSIFDGMEDWKLNGSSTYYAMLQCDFLGYGLPLWPMILALS